MLSERIIPTGEPPTPLSFDSNLVSLILNLLDLSSCTHLVLIGLFYALGLCHSFKSCVLPPSLWLHALFLSPFWAHSVTSTIFWRDSQKIAGLWEINTV